MKADGEKERECSFDRERMGIYGLYIGFSACSTMVKEPYGYLTLSLKEVIHHHLPVAVPCYDFIPVTSLTFGASLLAVESATSGRTNFHDVTGGVYKTRERIHGVIADTPLLAIPTSCSRVADYNPNWDRFYEICFTSRFAALCTGHCSTCVAPGIRAMRT